MPTAEKLVRHEVKGPVVTAAVLALLPEQPTESEIL
jgi:hypothetical protein